MNYLFHQHDYLEHGLSRGGAFYPESFESNLAGYLSARQKGRLIWVAGTWLVMAGVDLGLVAWVIYFQIFVPIPPFVGLFWSVILIMSAIMCLNFIWPMVEDLRDGRVKVITGQIRKYIVSSPKVGWRGGSTKAYFIETKHLVFDISGSVYDSVINGKTYRLVYLPHSKKLVNLEPLQPAAEEKSRSLASLQSKLLERQRPKSEKSASARR